MAQTALQSEFGDDPKLPDDPVQQQLSAPAATALSAVPSGFGAPTDEPKQAPALDVPKMLEQSQANNDRQFAFEKSAIEKNQATTKEMLSQKEKESKPFIDAAMQALNTPPPERPKLAPPPKLQDINQSVNLWMAAAYVFSGLAGALVRHNSTGALLAMGGMLNGFAAGRDDAIKQNFETWDRENKRALELNEQKIKEYEAAIADRQRPIVEAKAGLDLIAAKWQDTLMMQSKDFDTQMSLLDRQRESQTSAVKAATQVVDLANKVQSHTQQLNEQAINDAAELYLKTGTLPPSGRSGQGANMAAATRNKAAELATQRGIDMKELPKQWQLFKSQQVGMQRFLSGPQGNVVTSLNVVIDHIATLDEAAQAIKNGNVQRFNQISQQIAKETGQAAPTNLNLAAKIVGTEVIKALGVAGAGTADERSEIAHAWSQVNSPQQLAGASAISKKLLAGQLAGKRQQFQLATGLPIETFDEMLRPNTKKELEPLINNEAGVAQARQGMPGGSLGPQQQQQSVPVTATGPDGKKIILQNGQWQPMQ